MIVSPGKYTYGWVEVRWGGAEETGGKRERERERERERTTTTTTTTKVCGVSRNQQQQKKRQKSKNMSPPNNNTQNHTANVQTFKQTKRTSLSSALIIATNT